VQLSGDSQCLGTAQHRAALGNQQSLLFCLFRLFRLYNERSWAVTKKLDLCRFSISTHNLSSISKLWLS
jgi:hypothetical protein